MQIVGVGELTRYLKALLEEDFSLQDVWVRGEISNYSQPVSGHRYFSLKDETATLKCALFRGSAGWVPPLANGMAVLAHGRLSIYDQRGEYQLYVDAVEEAGIGELHLRFEELKARLEREGLFAEERKRALPPCPATVGVVTSASAAALRDILRTLRLRCPLARVILAPALVQGDGAAEQIAAAIDALNAHGEADVIIVARGGGSIEELWAFNEEAVARAIARSAAPVVTGVGHETDFTIADFVADYRASTPTGAANAVVPDASVWREEIAEAQARMSHLMAARVEAERAALSTAQHQFDRAGPKRRIAAGRQRVDEAVHALRLGTEHAVALRRERLSGTALRLHALSPLLTIARGYAVVRRAADGTVVTRVAQVALGQGVTVRVTDGSFAAVAGPRLDEAADAADAKPEAEAEVLARAPGRAAGRGARLPQTADARERAGTGDVND
jgi:exodeoxyribonuclease VII large subunit